MNRRATPPVDVDELHVKARVDAGRELVQTMVAPTLAQVATTQGSTAAEDMAVGAITQLAAVLVHHRGPKQAARMLMLIASACAQHGGH